jgi:ribokinase
VVNGTAVRFLVIGDATLDVTARGGVPVPGADRPADISVGPGGQGANVAVRLARGGASVTLQTAIGSDPIGVQLTALLGAEGVEVRSLGSPITGIVLSLVDEAGERAMLSSRVSAAPAPAIAEAIAAADWVHVSGYSLDDVISGAQLATAVGSRPASVRASVGGGSFGPRTAVADRIRASRPDLLLFDRAESAAILEADPATAARDLASQLARYFEAVAVVTDGAAGAVAASGPGTWTAAAPVQLVRDATGAGDAYAAFVLRSLAGGPWPPDDAALQAALQDAAGFGAEVAGAVGAQARVASEGRA